MKFYSEVMDLNINLAVAYLTFKELEKHTFVNHAFSTRLGGVSRDSFKSMNLSFKRGDEEKCVRENYKLFCDASGFDINSLVIPNLTHGSIVEKASKSNRGSGIFRTTDFIDADGLVTDQTGVTLVTSHADCPSIFVIDPNKKAIGLAHAGWRGTSKEISKKIINKMKDEFGSVSNDIVCCIGPSIAKCCFEVNENAISEFKKINFIEIDNIIIKRKNKLYIDLFQANKQILMNSGVKENNIILSDICTMCNKDLMFSHRASKGKSGTMLAMISIK